VKKQKEYYHNYKIHKLIVTDSSDWELITNNSERLFELLLDDNKDIYFKSNITDQEYRIGDKVTLKNRIEFGDGKRNFTIGKWYIGSSTPTEQNLFKHVYILSKEDGRSLHLDDVLVNNQ
jgi:hypothetical protein